MAVTDGHIFRIKKGSAVLAYATSDSFSKTRATRSRSHKDVAQGFVANDYGEGSWEASAEGLYEDGTSYEDMSDEMDAKTKVTLEISDAVTGHTKWTGTALITSLELNAPDNEDVTWSVSFTGDGPLTKGTIA